MSYSEEAQLSITRLIGELRKSGSEAFAAGAIDEAVKIGSWIKVLQGLSGVSPVPPLSGPAPSVAPRASETAVVQRSAAGKRQYPYFYRNGDELVKVGWSKTEKKPYEHKAPREAVDSTATALAHVGAAGRQFTANDLFAQSAIAGLPQYQVYLSLAWFRSAGLVVQKGKQGYTCTGSDLSVNTVRDLWQALEARH